MPRLGPHAELVARRPGFVKAKLSTAPTKPCVLHGVSEVLRIIVRWRPVDVLEINRGAAGHGVLRIVRGGCVADGHADIPRIAVDEPVDEDNNLIRGRAVA